MSKISVPMKNISGLLYSLTIILGLSDYKHLFSCVEFWTKYKISIVSQVEKNSMLYVTTFLCVQVVQ